MTKSLLSNTNCNVSALQTMNFSYSVSSQCISALHFLAFQITLAGLFLHGVLWSIISNRGINLPVSINSSPHPFISPLNPPCGRYPQGSLQSFSVFSSFRPYSSPVGSCGLSSQTYKCGHKQHRGHTERQMGRPRFLTRTKERFRFNGALTVRLGVI